MKLFALLCLCLLLPSCSVFHRTPKQGVISVQDHAHAQLLNVHSTLLLVQPRFEAKALPPEMMNAFQQTAQSFNTASRLWEDYQLARRVHGNQQWVFERFNEQVKHAVDLGGALKQQYALLPAPVVVAPKPATEEAKP